MLERCLTIFTVQIRVFEIETLNHANFDMSVLIKLFFINANLFKMQSRISLQWLNEEINIQLLSLGLYCVISLIKEKALEFKTLIKVPQTKNFIIFFIYLTS